jgi:hypothetical protein
MLTTRNLLLISLMGLHTEQPHAVWGIKRRSFQKATEVLLNKAELLYKTLKCSNFKQEKAYNAHMNF